MQDDVTIRFPVLNGLAWKNQHPFNLGRLANLGCKIIGVAAPLQYDFASYAGYDLRWWKSTLPTTHLFEPSNGTINVRSVESSGSLPIPVILQIAKTQKISAESIPLVLC